MAPAIMYRIDARIFVLALAVLTLFYAVFPASAQRITLVPITNAWRYDATTNDYGSAWKDFNYPDGSWAGPSNALFFNDSAVIPAPTNTFVPLTFVNSSTRILGYYYRTHFNFPTNPVGVTLIASNLVDDGAVFWINGMIAGRLRMTNTVVVRTNVASATPPGGDATTFETLTLTNHLVEGDNVLAVEVHQNSRTSTDTIFGMRLDAILPEPPVITNPVEPADRVVQQGRSTTLTASATGQPPPDYQWFHSNAVSGAFVAIPGATGPAYAITNMLESDGGEYYCQVTNAVGITKSRTAMVDYLADVFPPVFAYALGHPNRSNITVHFSEPVDPASIDPTFGNMTVTPVLGGDDLGVEVGWTLANGTNLALTTAIPRAIGVGYLLAINGVVLDFFGNEIANPSILPIAEVVVAGDNQVWAYFQSDTDPGAGWQQPGFNDTVAPWAFAQAAFYAKRGTPVTTVPLRTQLNLTNPPAAPIATHAYYFRTHFNSTGLVTRLQLRSLVDDGAVVYVNGHEVHRIRMAAAPAPISFTNFANHTVTDPEVVYELADIPADYLEDGDNVLAVEVHQVNLGSSDMYFAAELITSVTGARPVRPQLTVTYSGGGVIISWAGEGYVLLAADDPAGPWNDVMDPGLITANPYTKVAPAGHKFYALRQGP